jgi:DNA polymerase-3 subunit gamma/tau
LVGQDVVVRTLRTALSSGKLAHAYLFSGPRGSGKTSAAKILARCIECVAGPTPDPDNTCEFCQAILAGTAMDVMEIDAASNRGIDEIRALRESAKFAPSVMRAKVFIVDEAHMLTREGANAFLKTLEEPPPHTVFILATTAPEQLPPTILSRCQRYAFRRIPIPVMIDRMRTIAQAEGIAIDDDALGAIAYRADGGLRDALTMLEQVASYAADPAAASGTIDVATVDAAFGSTGRGHAQAIVRAIVAGDAVAALRAVDEANDAGADMVALMRAAIAEYRDLLVARLDPALLERDLSAGDAATAVDLARATPQPTVVRGLRLLSDALAAGRSAGNPRLELETAILRLVVQGEDPSLEALATRVALLEGADPAATPRRAAAPPASAANAPAGGAPLPSASAPLPAVSAPPPPAATAAPAPVEPAQPERKPAPAPKAAPRPAADPPARPQRAAEPAVSVLSDHPEPTLQRVRSLWASIRKRAEDERGSLRAALGGAMVDEVTDSAVTVRHPVPSLADTLKEPKNTEIIERAIADVLGRNLRFIVRGDAGRSATHAAHGRSSSPAAIDANGEPMEHPEHDLLSYAQSVRLGVNE